MTSTLIIQTAEAALRTFGDLTREQAAQMLPLWRRYPELTREQRTAVLRRFGGAR